MTDHRHPEATKAHAMLTALASIENELDQRRARRDELVLRVTATLAHVEDMQGVDPALRKQLCVSLTELNAG